ncbi:hypothetical protein ACHAPM_011621 [Fusarium culmorum]
MLTHVCYQSVILLQQGQQIDDTVIQMAHKEQKVLVALHNGANKGGKLLRSKLGQDETDTPTLPTPCGPQTPD